MKHITLVNLLLCCAAWASTCHERLSSYPENLSAAIEMYCELNWHPDHINRHLSGISINHPVQVIELKKGTIISRWQDPSRGLGHYFMREVCLHVGVSLKNRELKHFEVVQDTIALASTAADIIDDWTGMPEVTFGGGEQLFLPDLKVLLPL